jgi:hypothetical protein
MSQMPRSIPAPRRGRLVFVKCFRHWRTGRLVFPKRAKCFAFWVAA